MKRAVLYARVSTDHEDQTNSISAQIKMYDEYCKMYDYEKVEDVGLLYKKNGSREFVSGIYGDEGISGVSSLKRIAFNQMKSDAKQGKFDVVVTKQISRFGRSVEDVSRTCKDLGELGISVFFHLEKFDSLNKSHELMINVLASVAQEESSSKSESVKFGIRAAQSNGKWTTGNPPYGYDMHEGFLVINEHESIVVKKMADLYYNEGFGTSKIARYLNDNEIKTKKGKKWSQTQIVRMLDNPIYTGLQIQHVVETKDINRKTQGNVPEEEWIKHTFPHLQIIDKELYKLIQIEKQRRLDEWGQIEYKETRYTNEDGEYKIRKDRSLKRGAGRHSGSHLFSTILKCGNCGTSLKRKKRNGHGKDLGYEWCCGTNDRYGKQKCAYRSSTPEETLNEFIKSEIEAYRNGKKFDISVYVTTYFHWDNMDESIEEVENEILKFDRQRNKNFELLDEDIISKEEYKKRNDEIQTSLTQANVKKNNLLNREKDIEEVKLKYEEFKTFVNNVDVDNLTNSELRKIIDKITVYTLNGQRHLATNWKFMDTDEGKIVDDLISRPEIMPHWNKIVNRAEEYVKEWENK